MGCCSGPALQGICALLFFRLFRFCSFKKILENSLQRHGHRLPFFIGILFEALIYHAVDVVIDMPAVFLFSGHRLSPLPIPHFAVKFSCQSIHNRMVFGTILEELCISFCTLHIRSLCRIVKYFGEHILLEDLLSV